MALTTDAAITRLSSLAIVPDPENPNNGFYAPALTAAQRDAIPADVLSNGGIIYNTTANQLQGYINGAWSEISTAGGVDFIAPSLGADPAVQNGRLYYNTGTNQLKVCVNGAFVQVLVSNNTAGGVGIGNNSSLVLPTGTTVAVETPTAPAANNRVNGFTFFNSTLNWLRGYVNGAWATVVTTVSGAATGEGLVAGNSPFVCPTGPTANVETGGNNNVNGFLFYNSTFNRLRARINGAWATVVTTVSGAATGEDLTAGNTPLVLPTGPSSVETVNGNINAVAGFLYYNTETNLMRLRTNAAWISFTPLP